MIDTDHYLHPGVAEDVRTTPRGLQAGLGREQLRVDVVRADVVRIAISRGGVFDERPTHALCVDPFASAVPFTVDVQEDGKSAVLRTDGLVVTLGADPFRLDVHRPDGSPVLETSSDPDGHPWAYATLNDAFTFRRQRRPHDSFYGLGEKGGRFDRSGRDFTMWNTDVLSPHGSAEFTAARRPDDPRSDRTSPEFDPFYVSVPFFYHQDGKTRAMSGSFLDNGYRLHYDFTSPTEYRVQAEGGQYVEYVFAGPDMAGILDAFTWLTGRPGLPPLWALGYQQCRWHGYSGEMVEALAARHHELGLPLDALWLDIEHMDGYRVFTWNAELFPDPDAMLRRLREAGVRLVTIVDPGLKREPGYRLYDEATAADLVCHTEGGDQYVGQVWPGDTVFPDFALEETRRWWGDLNAAHVARGVSGIWNDMNEPATGRIPPHRMRFQRGQLSHERLHNQYALLMAMATAEGLTRADPDSRPFILSRAGFAGIQRYAANWMGDNLARWDHLAGSIPMATGFGVSGQPFVGADVGGFQGDSRPELFLRWMQYGVFTPFCRNHSEIGYVDQYAWSFGDAILALVREALRLRYRLMPYLYATFEASARTGAPVQRPLVFDHQGDPLSSEQDDQFLLGTDILVAPVLEAGMTSRIVYLPEGGWYDLVTNEHHQGAAFVTVPTPMERIPVFVRSGAVLPMWPEVPASTAGYHPTVIELHLYLPQSDGSRASVLYEDDGLTRAAERGAFRRTDLTLTRRGDEVTLSGRASGDGYPEFVREAFHIVVHGGRVGSVTADGSPARVQEDGRIVVSNRGGDVEVTLRLQGER